MSVPLAGSSLRGLAKFEGLLNGLNGLMMSRMWLVKNPDGGGTGGADNFLFNGESPLASDFGFIHRVSPHGRSRG